MSNITKYGVDSALFIEKSRDCDVCMEIFEKDGSESDFCGNGAILITHLLGLNKGTVKTKDGVALAEGSSNKQAIFLDIKLSQIEELGDDKNCLFVRMGEPHIIFKVEDIEKIDLMNIGNKLQKKYSKGVNVDAIQKLDELHYLIRTYERGVCAETRSCGTGSLSSYIAVSYFCDKIFTEPIHFKSEGGCHLVSRTNDMLKLEVPKKYLLTDSSGFDRTN